MNNSKSVGKARGLTVLVLTLAVLIAAGCKKKDRLSSTGFKTPSGPISFTLQWNPGEKVNQQLDMTQLMDFVPPGQKIPVQQEVSMAENFQLTVLSNLSGGGHAVELEFEQARMKMKRAGIIVVDFDSTNEPVNTNSIFARLVGAKVLYILDSSNDVSRVEGVEDIVKRLSAGAPQNELGIIRGVYNEDFFKQLMSQNRYMPKKPVKPGDTWPVELDMPMGGMGTMQLNFIFTFKNWEVVGHRNSARLNYIGSVGLKPNSVSSKSVVTVSDLRGTNAGSSWFDPELGLTLGTIMKEDISMTMHSTQPKLNGTKMHMQESMTVKVLSVK